MQVTKNIKYITFISLILLFSLPLLSQEDVDIGVETTIDSISNNNENKKSKFKFFSFLKKKDNESEDEFEDDNELNDSTETKRKKFKLFNLFRRRNKNDSIYGDSIPSDSINVAHDSIQTKKKFSWLKKNKDNSEGGVSKPDRIKIITWNKMNAEEQDSLFKAWDAYDREFYKKKYAFTKKEVEIAIKRDRNFLEKIIYKRARKKPLRHKRKIINRQNKRYKKTLGFERLNKSETALSDSMSDERRYKIVNKQYKRGAKREAIRKNKIVLKYDKKEARLRRRYELSDNEKIILNKGRGMRFRGAEKLTFTKARKKQETFTIKLLKLRRKRSFALQSKNVQDRMKKNKKRDTKRDAKRYIMVFKKKKKKKYYKHDSDEYPKNYQK